MRAVALAIVMLVGATSALAAPCSRDDVAAQVAQLGGPSLDDVDQRVQIEIHGLEGSVTYVMSSGDVVGPRVVNAASCRELAKSLALVLVMSWRADDPAPAPPALVEPAPIAPPTVKEAVIEIPPVTIERASEPPQPRMSTRHVAVIAGGASDATGTPALVLGGRWRHGRFSAGLELHLTAPLTLDVGDGGSVRVTQNALDALPCF